MTTASRTPEGLPSHCPLCGDTTNLEFAEPIGDAPCPRCGHLVWRSSQLLAQLQHSLATSLSVPESEISSDTSFADDLKADSLDVVELMMEFEEAIDVTIPDEDYKQIRTIGDAVRYIERQERIR